MIIRDIGDLNVGVNVMSVRINVWATSRQVSRRAAKETEVWYSPTSAS